MELGRAVADLATIQRVADSMLEAGGIWRPPVPLNIVALAPVDARISLHRRDLGEVRGVVWFRPDCGWMILTNAALPEPAQRFVVMHECYHLLVQAGALPWRRISAYREWLADQFAVRLLMPAPWVRAAWQRQACPERLAAQFGVSRRAMARRLKEIGGINEHGRTLEGIAVGD